VSEATEAQPGSADSRLAPTSAAALCLLRMRELAGADPAPMENHCERVFVIASELGQAESREVDEEVLACAASLHDAGLFDGAASKDKTYVEDGARLARELLEPLGWTAERLQRCMDAIECHHELRSQWAKGAEVELMRRADLVDVSAGVVNFGFSRSRYRELVAEVPREGMYRGVAGLVGHALRERPLTMLKIFRR
jgi:hypothetical protein